MFNLYYMEKSVNFQMYDFGNHAMAVSTMNIV